MRRLPRAVARAPVPIFRAGLGPLLGGALVMVEHRGRVTGRSRTVVLEVVERAGRAGRGGVPTIVVVAGFGPGSQWYRNVAAEPRVRVWWGTRRAVPAVAELLGPVGSAEVLRRYRAAHPWRARFVSRALGVPALASGPVDAGLVARLPAVRLRPVR
ncbi:nitroreductase family deazaflavin-dependent oxidoreductase [Georgenia sp. M64]|uniref:nitroreductase family deazaflavin-dependent oxidoreductase n=1 Tax=Georgenia sp. M64 TaxID=3120520 RepID=UPI0030E14DB9